MHTDLKSRLLLADGVRGRYAAAYAMQTLLDIGAVPEGAEALDFAALMDAEHEDHDHAVDEAASRLWQFRGAAWAVSFDAGDVWLEELQ